MHRYITSLIKAPKNESYHIPGNKLALKSSLGFLMAACSFISIGPSVQEQLRITQTGRQRDRWLSTVRCDLPCEMIPHALFMILCFYLNLCNVNIIVFLKWDKCVIVCLLKACE